MRFSIALASALVLLMMSITSPTTADTADPANTNQPSIIFQENAANQPAQSNSGSTNAPDPMYWAGYAKKDWPGVAPRYTVRHDFGDGVGYQNGFTYLEGFIPVLQRNWNTLWYGDLRVVNFDDINLWEFNAGGGYRFYHADTNRIYGVNMFYDGRNTDSLFYHQIGAGFETLGECVDFRINGYFPLGDRETTLGFSNFRFQNFNIAMDRNVDVALGGFDMEVGTPIPLIERFDTRAFVGYYFYTGGEKDAHGISGRLESKLSEAATLHFAVHHDQVFDTTVTGGLAFHFGGGRLARALQPFGRRPVPSRLDDRVVRDPNIVISREARQELAIDPKTNQPIIVRHVNSNVAPGGDGSFENPYNHLLDLQNGSNPNEILFAHANSVFPGQKIYLQNHQRFLGEGIDHLFTSTQGTFLLPRATNGTLLPAIFHSPGNSITLANNTEVSGFQIVSPIGKDANGIFGENVSYVNINRNFFTIPIKEKKEPKGGNDGIDLENVNHFHITNNTFYDINDDGIDIEATGKNKISGHIENNTFHKIGENAIEVVVADTAVVDLSKSIVGNNFLNIGDNAISITTNDNSAINTRIANNSFLDIGDDAVEINLFGSSRAFALIKENVMVDVDDSAVQLNLNDDVELAATIDGNIIRDLSDVLDSGISINADLDDTDDLLTGKISILNNDISGAEFAAVEIGIFDHDNDSDMLLYTNISGNRFLNNETGVDFFHDDSDTDGGVFHVKAVTNIDNNVFLNNKDDILIGAFNGSNSATGKAYTYIFNITHNQFLNTKNDAIRLEVVEIDTEPSIDEELFTFNINVAGNKFVNIMDDAISYEVNSITEEGVVVNSLIAGNIFLDTIGVTDDFVEMNISDDASLTTHIVTNTFTGFAKSGTAINIDTDTDIGNTVHISGNILSNLDNGVLINSDGAVTTIFSALDNSVKNTNNNETITGNIVGTILINGVPQP